MRWMRSTWGSRLLAMGLVLTLLPSALLPAAHAAQRVGCTSYADWLRTQLRGPADEAVEAALEAASTARVRSLQAFLTVFVQSYSARHPAAQLSAAFSSHPYSNEALVTFLEGRYQRVKGEDWLAPVRLMQALTPSAKAMDRLGETVAVVAGRAARRAVPVSSVTAVFRQPALWLLRVLSSARPLGP